MSVRGPQITACRSLSMISCPSPRPTHTDTTLLLRATDRITNRKSFILHLGGRRRTPRIGHRSGRAAVGRPDQSGVTGVCCAAMSSYTGRPPEVRREHLSWRPDVSPDLSPWRAAQWSLCASPVARPHSRRGSRPTPKEIIAFHAWKVIFSLVVRPRVYIPAVRPVFPLFPPLWETG